MELTGGGINFSGRETVLDLAVIWVISMLLGKARRETGGLLAPMLCHFVFNLFAHTMFRVVRL